MFKLTDYKSISEREDKTNKWWKEKKIFERSIEERPADNQYSFLDGPPFVTGMPHFGHLVGRIAKDVIPRYQTMKGKRVRRVWGWDCHGLPIEEKVEKKLGLKNRREVEKFGINKFLQECFNYVESVSSEWEWYVDKIGEWIDFKNAYKTMHTPYMESVIWVFKQLYEKDLVYEGVKTLLYCTRCGTPVSKFEIAMDDSYADMEDPAITVEFPITTKGTFEGARLLAWTTTPWTMPSNRALVVDPNETYVRVKVQKLDIELEKAWLVQELPQDLRKQKSVQITQAYLEKYKDENGKSVKDARIRKMGDKFTFTVKYFAGSEKETGQVIEKTEEITKERYVELIKTATKKVVKSRYYYPLDKKLTAEIDVYQNNLEGLVVIEVEFPTLKAEKAFKEPAWFGKEVTDSKGIYPPVIADMPIAAVHALNDDYQQEPHHFEEHAQTKEVIFAKKRLREVLQDVEYSIVDEFQGKELVGLSYTAPYNYYHPNGNDWKVYEYKGMVTMDEGVGIVHSAPGFGEIDTEMGQKNGLTMMFAVDDEGKFKKEVKDFAGIYVKDADALIIDDLRKKGVLFKLERITHRYPYCYRCQTPLIQRAQPGWFINVQKIKPLLKKNAQEINWVPPKLQKRFDNNLEDAPDWNISRTRYWATIMPVWKCESCGEQEIFGSIKEIEERSGETVKNLHRDGVDHITFECKKCKGEMKRIPEVLDVWVESGSMPYGQLHYPFENEELFKYTFPGDYIIEYVAQIRAWFYVMHVISNALQGQNSFKNVVVTGTLAGTDGRKMSKMYGNYPDPKETLERLGGDAIRLYMMGSNIMLGEDPSLSEEEMRSQVTKVVFPLWNAVKYFTTYANLADWKPADSRQRTANSVQKTENSKQIAGNSLHVLDQWILARLKQFGNEMDQFLSTYYMPQAARLVAPFINDLSTWYIRRSRDRFVALDPEALETLYFVLVEVAKLIAPLAPFIAEEMYQVLVKDQLTDNPDSVHLCMFPETQDLSDEENKLINQMESVRTLASVGLSIRVLESLKIRQPVATFQTAEMEMDDWMIEILEEELNVKKVEYVKEVAEEDGWTVSGKSRMNTSLTDELRQEGLVRELVRVIQDTRKKAGFKPEDEVVVTVETGDSGVQAVVEKYGKELCSQTKSSKVAVGKVENGSEVKVNGVEVMLMISK